MMLAKNNETRKYSMYIPKEDSIGFVQKKNRRFLKNISTHLLTFKPSLVAGNTGSDGRDGIPGPDVLTARTRNWYLLSVSNSEI